MANDVLGVALITDVFETPADEPRLIERMREASRLGARLAVLPEIPLNRWAPATKAAIDDDAEAPDGPRHRMLARAAREAKVWIVGGAIVRDPATGVRRNTALTFDSNGKLISTFAKLHLPEEPGFWETSHYKPGEAHARPIPGLPIPFGVQICSDINRPEGCHALAAMGAGLIANPRATEAATYHRWRHTFIANAYTSRAYIISVNRPGPDGVGMGGPSIAVAPDTSILCETTEPVAVVRLEAAALERARIAYPGYLPVRSDLYARAWEDAARIAPRGA